MVNKNLEFDEAATKTIEKLRDCQFQLVLLDTWGIGWHRVTTRAPCLVLQFQNATRPLKYGSLQQSQALGVSNAHEALLTSWRMPFHRIFYPILNFQSSISRASRGVF